MAELNQFLSKYELYVNVPETNAANIRGFIYAYNELEFKDEFLISTVKADYVLTLDGPEATNATIVYNFISGDFDGLIDEGGE